MASGDGLHRYWLTLAAPQPVGFAMGCGVTAFTEDDARQLLARHMSKPPVIVGVDTDIDISTLERNHVMPNIGDYRVRGVWFPNFGPE